MTTKSGIKMMVLLAALFFAGAFLLYFGVLLYSECGLPGQSWTNLEKKRMVQAALLGLAPVLIASRPLDRRAQVGALFLAVAGTAPAFPHEEMRAVWRSLPKLLGAMLWIPQLAHFMALPLFFTFYALLPRPVFQKPWQFAVVWLPAVVLSGLGIKELYLRVYDLDGAHDLPRWYLFVVGLSVLLYGFGGLGALVGNFARSDRVERRRLLVLTAGSVAGWSPGLLFLAAIFLAPFTNSSIVWALVVPPFKHVALAMFVLVPLSLAYAFMRDRVLDLPC